MQTKQNCKLNTKTDSPETPTSSPQNPPTNYQTRAGAHPPRQQAVISRASRRKNNRQYRVAQWAGRRKASRDDRTPRRVEFHRCAEAARLRKTMRGPPEKKARALSGGPAWRLARVIELPPALPTRGGGALPTRGPFPSRRPVPAPRCAEGEKAGGPPRSAPAPGPECFRAYR